MYRRLVSASFTFILILAATSVRAAFTLPQSMNTGERQEALRIIGLGTSAKSLTDPYSLGGFTGLEVGLSLETIPTEDLARLGSGVSTPQSDVTIPKLTIGKGLYSNLDFFIHFIPYSQQTELSQYGGILRWSFFEASSLPLSASLVAHFNSGNFSNQLTTRSFGLDLVGGINVNEVSLYAGVGGVQATGNFIGGANGITDSTRLETEGVSTLHTLVGGSFRLNKIFVAAQLDHYSQSVVSAKLGLRF